MRCPGSVVVNVLVSYLYDPSLFPLSTVYERLYIYPLGHVGFLRALQLPPILMTLSS